MDDKEEALYIKALKFLKETRLKKEFGIDAEVTFVRVPEEAEAS